MQGGSSAGGLAWKQLLREAQIFSDSPEPLRTVHRLDAGTTGALILAKTAASAKSLSTQFKSHQVGKRYLAIVQKGRTGWSTHAGQIDSHIQLMESGPRLLLGLVSTSNAKGSPLQPATASWKVLSTSDKFSLVEFSPKTGRKHQLRLMSSQALGAPVVGDFKYGYQGPPVSGHLLHCSQLRFYYWLKTGKRQTVAVDAPLPASFRDFAQSNALSLPQNVELAS